MTQRALPLLAIVIAFALPGCNLVPERTPVTLYELPAQALDPAAHGSSWNGTALRLATPDASGLLDGARILVVPMPNQPQVYAGVRWADTMPQLIRNRLLDAFQDDGRIPSLVHADSNVSADVELLSDLRSFHSRYRNGLPEATLRLDVRLIDTRSQRLLASRRFTQNQPVGSESIDAVVDAFGMAADRLARELVDWTVNRLEDR